MRGSPKLSGSPASRCRVGAVAVRGVVVGRQRDYGRSVSTRRWIPAYVGLGSNLDEPPLQIARAFEALEQLADTRVVLRSRRYRTRPLGPVSRTSSMPRRGC